MKKIALINCYLGEFPWYFPFFIKSCITNSTIDFVIFSDANYDSFLPTNVKIIPFTLNQFNQLATQKLGFEIAVQNSYKLCEFKPAFGFLFSDYVENYDFWGITDIDVIYGRIREFMTPDVLDTHDIICVRHDYITACCMLFRNNDYINTLFKKSSDYKMVFTTNHYYGFDETNFEQETITDKQDIFKINCQIETIQHVVLKEEDKGNLKAHFDLFICDGNPGKLKWDNGLLSYNNQFEILLYHLQNYKNNFFAKNSFDCNEIPNNFYIDKYSFREDKSIMSYLRFFCTDFIKPIWWNCNKKLAVFLSLHLFKNKFKILDEGEYLYTLSKRNIFISKEKNGVNYLKFQDSMKYELYHITFCKNYFFAKGLNIIFKLKKEQNRALNTFSIIASNGFGITYNKLK